MRIISKLFDIIRTVFAQEYYANNFSKNNKKTTRTLKKEYQRNINKKSEIDTNKPGINYSVNTEDRVYIKNSERDYENKTNKFTKRTTNVDGEWSKTNYIISNVLKNNSNIGPPCSISIEGQ